MVAGTRASRVRVVAVTLGVATLSLGTTPAGAIVAKIGARGYGVTPITSVSSASIPGTSQVPGSPELSGVGSSGLSGAPGVRNFDGPPSGGGPLLYHSGGSVMHSNNTHVIYWDPNKEFTAKTKEVVSKFFTDVAHDSGLASNVFGILGQYTDATGNAAYNASFAGALADADAYPSSGNCKVPKEEFADPGPPYTKCLFDSQLRTELSAYIGANKLPKGPTQLYFLLLPHKVVTCFNETKKEEEEFGQVCSNNYFCAYHSYIEPVGTSEIIYADIPFSLLDSVDAKGCQNDGNAAIQNPNGDTAGTNASTRYADVAVKYISHEYSESVTDPLLNAWFDANGLEIGDKCNGIGPNSEKNGIGYDANSFLPVLGGSASAGTLFDQSINVDPYYLQSEWDNAGKACLMKPVALSSAGFTATPESGLVGSPISFSGTATDRYGGLGFSWTFGDGGTGTGSSPSHTYGAPGTYTVTMTPKDALTGSTAAPVEHTVVVNDLPTASFTISPNPAPTSVAVGFNGSASNDPDGSIVSYEWNFGDGNIGSGATTSHTYVSSGTYTVTLTVTDSGKQTAKVTHSATITTLPAHWYQNNTRRGKAIAEGVSVPVISWGTLTLSSGAGTVSCKTAVMGNVQNPEGGGFGTEEATSFASADCVAAGCEAASGLEMLVTAEALPWSSVLEESESAGKAVVRDRTVGERLSTHCAFRPGFAAQLVSKEFEEKELKAQEVARGAYTGFPAEEPGRPPVINVPGDPVASCSGENAPRLKTGSGIGSKPSTVEYDSPGSGSLSCGAFGKGTTTGKLKTMGYGEEETIAGE